MIPLEKRSNRLRTEAQKRRIYEEFASQLQNSSGHRPRADAREAGDNGASMLAPNGVQLRSEWSTVLQQVLLRNASAPSRRSPRRGSPTGVGRSRLQARDLAAVAAAAGQEVHRLASCGGESSTAIPSQRSTPMSTPRSYVAFTAPAGRLLAWRDVAVRTTDTADDISERSSFDESSVQLIPQEMASPHEEQWPSRTNLRSPTAQAGKKVVPLLRLDKLPTVMEPDSPH